MERGLNELGITDITPDDIFLLFRRFDIDQDGMLKFSEFTHIIAPI
jgi:Ca2+-binding EF-hand superfamily protein